MVNKSIQGATHLAHTEKSANNDMQESFLQHAKQKKLKGQIPEQMSLAAMLPQLMTPLPFNAKGERGGSTLQNPDYKNKYVSKTGKEWQAFQEQSYASNLSHVISVTNSKKELMSPYSNLKQKKPTLDIKPMPVKSESAGCNSLFENTSLDKNATFTNLKKTLTEETRLILTSSEDRNHNSKIFINHDPVLMYASDRNLNIMPATLSNKKGNIENNEKLNNKLVTAQLSQIKNRVNYTENMNETQKPISFNFQFQRWSGEHSVKVSLPQENFREGNVILQASDSRAADAMQRHIEHWPKQAPEIYHLERDDEERENHSQGQDQEEEQE